MQVYVDSLNHLLIIPHDDKMLHTSIPQGTGIAPLARQLLQDYADHPGQVPTAYPDEVDTSFPPPPSPSGQTPIPLAPPDPTTPNPNA